MAEKRVLDVEEENKVQHFMQNGCTCKFGPNESRCIEQFLKKDIEGIRDDMYELSSTERDLLLMGFILANKSTNFQTHFLLRGHRVCRDAFLFCFNISKTLYATLCNHVRTNGVVVREHGNKGKLPHNLKPLESRQYAETFLQCYAEINAMVLPGRVPYYRDEEARIQLLPSHETKKSVYLEYRAACACVDLPILGLSTFTEFWRERLPDIVIAKTMSDLCWVCQAGNARLVRERAKPFEDQDDQHDKAALEHSKHVVLAVEEQRYYRAQCDKAKEDAKKLVIASENFDLFSQKPHCSFDGMAHYSWDFAQQVHYPYNPQQPGPIYFKTPRKCSIFGVCNDGFNMQYNYLIDEMVSTGKGANATISYVHHFLETFSLGEKNAYLHADNCSGKNFFQN